MKFLDFVIRLFIDDSTKERLKGEGKDSKGFKGILRVFLGHFHQFTLYNPLGLISGIVFTATLFHPWWFASVHNNYSTIRAYPFVLRHDLPPGGIKFVIETPLILAVFLILVLAGYLFLAFWGSTMAGKKGKLFLVWSGMFMLIYTAGFYGSILFATYRVNLPVTGDEVINYLVPVDVIMQFMRPYYLAIGAAIICILSALLHGRISIKFFRTHRVR